MTVFITRDGQHINCDDGRHRVVDQRRSARDRARDTGGRDDRDDDTVTMSAADLEEMIAKAVRAAFKKQLAGAEDDDPDEDFEGEAGERLARLGGVPPSPGPLLNGRAGDRRARDSGRRRAHDAAIPVDYDFAAIVQRERY